MRAKAFLFGPFVGELCWEFFRFAPYAIYLKKNNPATRLIVLSRESRFDLYGQSADILVPMRLLDDTYFERDAFKLIGFKEEKYYSVAKYFREKFKKRYQIQGHYYPDIRLWRYKVKWQFPREKMDYNFFPRKKNKLLANTIFKNYVGIVDNLATKKTINRDGIIGSIDLFEKINKAIDGKDCTSLGCLIECIRLAKFIIGDIRYDISHLAMLLKIPLIHVGNFLKEDYINLLNPLRTPMIISNTIKEGISIYENNF